ncbi:Alpha-1,6-mannosyltransferase MNN10 [Heracleum sosnowskyi]|uniref:Alpha-1,6-mannosyltransferase MNN10 n=1 Tax=Heracleum sosnowskyi TaxID=360622 RepID=A0AAD8MYD8_9APIA|nr:Alpha-1,6-mannosyltransferase MNN10 [Heracleum sosnowskyi]
MKDTQAQVQLHTCNGLTSCVHTYTLCFLFISVLGNFELRTFHNFKTPRAALDGTNQETSTPVFVEEEEEDKHQPSEDIRRSVEVLKNAAKTRKVAAEEILSAFKILEKAKLDPSGFLDTLGGTESPGRTWMLVFTAKKQLDGGKYFPITAIQRFDAVGKRIENGVYLGPLGWLTFEGRLSWKKRILAFMFERLRIKIGPFSPFDINIKGKDESEPSTKNPFFIWFYIDEEIAVARGRSGGTAFWCRCRHVESY